MYCAYGNVGLIFDLNNSRTYKGVIMAKVTKVVTLPKAQAKFVNPWQLVGEGPNDPHFDDHKDNGVEGSGHSDNHSDFNWKDLGAYVNECKTDKVAQVINKFESMIQELNAELNKCK